jgi:hypothetical protein
MPATLGQRTYFLRFFRHLMFRLRDTLRVAASLSTQDPCRDRLFEIADDVVAAFFSGEEVQDVFRGPAYRALLDLREALNKHAPTRAMVAATEFLKATA